MASRPARCSLWPRKPTTKNLKVGVGLMSRHQRGLQQLAERIHGGEIGDLVLLRGYRMDGPAASFRSLRRPDSISEVAYQIQRFHSFLWASGGCFSDFNIHIIDHCCWMKNAWPVEAQALGGRHYRGDYVDQNFDTYSVEYSFADGTRFIMDGRCIDGCEDYLQQLCPRHQGHGDHLAQRRLRRPFGHLQGLGSSKQRPHLAIAGRRRARKTPIRTNGTTWSMPFAQQALQRGEAGRRGQPDDLHGPPRRAHRARSSPSMRCSTATTSSRPPSTSSPWTAPRR